MLKVLVLYYSRTGNTGKMASAVAEGAKSVGDVDVELSFHVEAEALADCGAVVVGCPTYHHDMALDLKMLFEEVAVKGISLKGKVGAAFGSYGWSGEAPKLVLEILRNKFEMEMSEVPLLCKFAPDEAMLEKCKELGKRVAERLKQSIVVS